MHMSRGRPFTSAEHEPHLPALQFQAGQVIGLLGLDLVDRVGTTTFGNFGRVILEPPPVAIAQI